MLLMFVIVDVVVDVVVFHGGHLSLSMLFMFVIVDVVVDVVVVDEFFPRRTFVIVFFSHQLLQ